MIDPHINNPKSIKYYVNQYFTGLKNELKGKIIVDIPAGNGSTSEILVNMEADVRPFDLFPEYFMLDGVKCVRADIIDKLPLENNTADMLICQEGIEHFSDQLKVFKEFNRVLKKQGQLVITVPSYSNLAAKFSYLLFESESKHLMPPNEIDDIWMSDKTITNEIYYGHIFLIGLQRLRTIGRLSGFKIHEVRKTKLSKGSVVLFPFFYPLILLRSYITYWKHMKREKNLPVEDKKSVYREQLMMNISVKNLLNKFTFIVFEKEKNTDEVDFSNEALMKPLDKLM